MRSKKLKTEFPLIHMNVFFIFSVSFINSFFFKLQISSIAHNDTGVSFFPVLIRIL